MLRDVFYYGNKPNVHPREQFAESLADARQKSTTRDFWIINEFCDYRNFDWDFDFEFLPDEDVWAEDHNNVWPSQHQKDSGTWLCAKNPSDIIIYRGDVNPVHRKNEKNDNWVELDLIDHTKFDFSWHPDPTEPPFIYRWGCKFFPAEFKHVLEYHVPGATQIKYMNSVVELLPEWDKWIEKQPVNHHRFDFSWRPDPLDPPFIYIWGNKFFDGKSSPTLEYHVPGATDKKYMPELVPLSPSIDNFEFFEDIDKNSFDFSWRPDPTSPPYIYAWGNQWNNVEDKISIQYKVEGATEYKYMTEKTTRLPCKDSWIIPDDVDTSNFDFSWEPNPASPAYIYEFATQWQKTGGPQYVVSGATEKKYVDVQKAKKLPSNEGWTVPDNIDISGFDFSWHPDATSPPYVYVFATQWAFSGGPVYTVPDATEIKYVDDQIATAKVDMTNWVYDESLIDMSSFDFSWHPYVEDQPYIYQFGTQWQKTGGPKYITPGADSSSPTKYIDTRIIKATRLPNSESFTVLNDYKIKDFDYSWHPDETEEPYIYVFGNTLYPVEEMPTLHYAVKGATTYKFVQNNVATLDVDMTNWTVPDDIDVSDFDFSWKPNPEHPPYIYEFSTQWQKTGGPIYTVPSASDIKYLDCQTATALVSTDNWTYDEYLDQSSFDFSWHPDATDPPYIYVWGNQWVKAEDRAYVQYHVRGATEYRYMGDTAKRSPCMDNWEVPDDIDVSNFDFSWEPSPKEDPFIYQFGTQWQKTGGPRYIVNSATDIKYVDVQHAIKLPNKNAFNILDNYKIKDFDFSWHPDETEEPYIYVFGNNLYPAEECATVEYRVEEATQVKYVSTLVAVLDVDMTHWEVPENIDTTGFDFSWVPNPNDPLYIYEFATQWQKTGGPRYVVENATEFKYLDFQKVTAKPNKNAWEIPSNVDVTDFDFSWHPDATDPPYVYQFGTQWALTGGPKYIIENADEVKYMDVLVAKALPDRTNWVYDESLINIDSFDFSWHPYVEDQPYIYQFGTQWQKTGGPKYITPGADSSSPTKYIDTRILRATRLPNENDKNWYPLYSVADFDYSWHPDETEEPYIYVFGNNLYPAEECATVQYSVPGATQVKFVRDIVATLGVDMRNWDIPANVDVTGFDFSWVPNPNDPPYIYEFATQWQKTGGPRYVVDGATEFKYLDFQKVIAIANHNGWVIPDNVDVADFDFSWHPDNTDPAYIYQFGTQWALSGGPQYVVEGATEIKYMDVLTAKALPDRTNWVYDESLIDADSFDFSWHPYVEDQPYIYQFGTQWQKTGGPRYITPGADSSSPTKYIDTRILKAKRLPDKTNSNWNVLYEIDDFDYSWHPDETEEPYIYVFGNQWYNAEVMPTIEYSMSGATAVKYISELTAKLASNMQNWEVPKNLDTTEFDFSWRPEPGSPPFIHQFGTQWQKTGGPKYVAESATAIKYNDIQKAKRLPNKENWSVPANVDATEFDFSWHPDDTDPAYIYQFGTQWALSGGPKYIVPDATEMKYVEHPTAKALPDKTNWVYDSSQIDVGSFDFSWHPYVEDQPYIYQFGTQWQKTGGPKYITPGSDSASPIKYIDTRIIKAKRLPNKDKFKILNNHRIKEFDYSWHPDDTEPAYKYVFGNNLYPAEECATVEYRVADGTEVKFVTDIVAKLDKNMTNWEISAGVDVSAFDFSWMPHPAAPPYIYQFGTKLDNNDGPRYITPNNDGEVVYLPRIELEEVEEHEEIIIHQYNIETTLEELVKKHPDEVFWATRKNIDYSNFDFDWRPGTVEVAWELNYVHVFGSVDSELTHTYFVSAKHFLAGHTSFKYVEDIKLTSEVLPELFIKPDIFYVDRGNPEAAERFEMLKTKLGNTIQKTRYLNSWVDTISRCTNRATSELIWVLNSELDYTNFDFNYYPNPWQMKMVHVFGTQHSHWGTTFMVNRETFREDTKYIKIIEHLSNLNFVKEHRAIATACVHDIILIDHGNRETEKVADLLTTKAGSRSVTVVKYNTSYLNTIKDLLKKQQEKKEHYLWICSSVCDYTTFDFSYVVDPFAREQLHVFPSGMQKFGDTFFVDVNKAKTVVDELEKLEEFDKVNYNGSMRAKRLPEPIIVTSDDTHVNAALNISGFPYATLITSDNADIQVPETEPMNLWSSDTKNILVTSTGATRIVVPAEVKDHVTKELYEYPHIKRSPKLAMSNPLDIVFLSNGETGAEENWEHLLSVTKGLKNRVVRVDGINGRVAAYHAAAEASETPWMFTVFAKLKVSPKFDFNWQPDRMQSPKHYIFHAKNPVNGLTYGHQAMIAYNKKLTLANEGHGLDFTLDNEHEVVPLISGTANYNTDPFSTWRTAFREVLKLKADQTDVAQERLDAWLNKAQGDFAQFSIKGAIDADEYYEGVGGEFDQLKLSYEWDWLRKKFEEI